MSAYIYTWDPVFKKWCFSKTEPTEDAAKIHARILWKNGAAGIKIDVVTTVVEEKRPQ